MRRIAEKPKKELSCQFTRLFHLMNEELLLECFDRLRHNAVSDIDHVTKTQYAEHRTPNTEHLAENLRQLVDELHKMAYRPQAARRVYIPKPGSDKKRPFGVPALEDKLVQAGLSTILQAIYEQNF